MLDLINEIGFLFYPLTLFSTVASTFIIERSIYFVRLLKFSTYPFYPVILAELKRNAGLSKELRDEVISHKLLDVKESLEFGINVLRIIAVLSPMVGLLGTVIGMIKAFKIIASQNSPVAPSMIADGLWNAMLTTAYGLSIAIPALLAAFIFSRMSEKYLLKMQKMLNQESLKMEGANLDD